jgi:hypothetical protein
MFINIKKLVASAFACIIFLGCGHLASTQTSPQRFFRQDFGLYLPVFKDQLGSSLAFSGFGIMLDLGGLRITPDWRMESGFMAGFGLGAANTTGDGSAQSALHFNLRASQAYLRRLSAEQNRLRIDLGGRLDAGSQIQVFTSNDNNIFLYQLAATLGPQVQLSLPFQFISRDFEAHWGLGLPLVAYSVRPTFIGVDPSVISDETGVFDNARFVFLNKYLAYDYVLGIDRVLSNGNRFRFAYRGGFLSDRSQPNGTLQRAYGALTFGLLFNIPERERRRNF